MAQSAALKQFPFNWEGTDRAGKKIKGRTVASSESAVRTELRRQGVVPTRVRKQSQLFAKHGKVTPADIAVFSRQLATMMAAGIPMVQSFDIVGAGNENPAMQKLVLAIKADVEGGNSLASALAKLSTEKVKVAVIHTGVGGITESDVNLAAASRAVIIGFNVRPAGKAASVAEQEGVDIKLYNVIYTAIDEVRKAMAGLLAPTLVEKKLGKAEVLQVFTIPKIGSIAGCRVQEGKILRGAKVRIVRDSVQIWDGKIGSLRRIKEDVREVASGFDPSAVRLTGNVHGQPPFRGVLQHGGWRATHVSLPKTAGVDAAVLAPAEVEIG